MISNGLDDFVHREHASCMPGPLFVRSIRRDPLGDEPLLFFVERELFGTVVTITFLLRSEIRSEAPVCL